MQGPLAKLNTYSDFLEAIKTRIQHSQTSATLAVNTHLMLLYWDIGTGINAKQSAKGWGAKVVDSLAMDLRRSFPGMTGFSPRNLAYMRAFAATHSSRKTVEEIFSKLPWHHNITLLEKLSLPKERLWYAQKAIEYGWSRTILVIQIETGLFKREGKAITACCPCLSG